MRVRDVLIPFLVMPCLGCFTLTDALIQAKVESDFRKAYGDAWPSFSDPTVAAYLERFLAEKAEIEANPAAAFEVGSGIPCDMPLEDQQLLAGVFPEDEQADLDQGLAENGLSMTNEDARFALLEGRCLDGQLHGRVRYFTNLVRKTYQEGRLFQTQHSKEIVEGEFRNGSPAGPSTARSLTTSTTYSADHKTVLEFLGIAFRNLDGDTPVGPQVIFQAMDSGRKTTTVTEAKPGGWTETTTWNGSSKASRYTMKNGQFHGEFVMFARKQGVVNTPEIRYCYRHGEQIKTNDCRVE